MADSPVKVSFAEDLGTEVVDIYVGPERKHYVVHKNLLITQSEYFKKALTGSFLEAEENSIHLKEEDPAAVALLIGWLYKGVIPGTEKPTTSFANAIFSPSDAVKVLVSEQGTIHPFAHTRVPAQSSGGGLFGSLQQDFFQHICYQSQYAIFSPEELRLADYKVNRKYQSDAPATVITAPAILPPPPTPMAQPVTGLFGLAFPDASPQVNNQATGSSVFGSFSQAVNQSTNGISSGLANLAPSQSTTRLSAQPNTSQNQNMFSRLHNPTLTLSNVIPAPSTNQSSNPFAGHPNSYIFGNLGAPAPKTNQTTNISAHMSNSTSGTSSLSGGAAPATSQSQNPFAPSQSSTGNILFGGAAQFTNQPQNPSIGVNNSDVSPASQCQNPSTQAQSTSLFSRPLSSESLSTSLSQAASHAGISCNFVSVPPAAPTAGGIFGNLRPASTPQGNLFGASAAQNSLCGTPAPQSSLFGSLPPNPPAIHSPFGGGDHFSIYNPGTVLPEGAVIVTSRPQKAQNHTEFGYYPAIKYMKSPRNFIKGIPQSDPSGEQFIDLEIQQLALLNLCIMAETMCWPEVFNEAINAYIRGEHKIQRPITLDFIDRIYTRTYPESTLRTYVLDSICRLKTDGVDDIAPYMEMANKHADFLADMLGKLIGSCVPLNEMTDETIKNYLMDQIFSVNNENTTYDDKGKERADHNEV